MKITFCLPSFSMKPVGGYKIVFEYANRLVERGHDVSIIFNCEDKFKKYRLPKVFRRMASYYFVKTTPRWFSLNKTIKKVCAFGIKNKYLPDADIVIATAVQTSKDVNNLSKNKGHKFYLIQDFENWDYTNEEVMKTYEYKMEKLVISEWLKEIVDSKSDTPSVYIPNGLDLEMFRADKEIEKRNNFSLAMLYHNHERKGVKYGLEVIYKLKNKYPNLNVRLFGTPERPTDLPEWIDYTKNANQKQLCEIYNNSGVFLSTSINEGFGLTGAESMACGCALVSTLHQGVKEYAVHEKNALFSPIKDVDSLFQNVEKLFLDPSLRIKLAIQGNIDIQKLSWNNSVDLFDETMQKVLFE